MRLIHEQKNFVLPTDALLQRTCAYTRVPLSSHCTHAFSSFLYVQYTHSNDCAVGADLSTVH